MSAAGEGSGKDQTSIDRTQALLRVNSVPDKHAVTVLVLHMLSRIVAISPYPHVSETVVVSVAQ